MADISLSSEVAGALGKFFHGGRGPTHSALTRVFMAAGYSDADPYDGEVPNKEQRVLTVIAAAQRRPGNARYLVEELLTLLRLNEVFGDHSMSADVARLTRALQRQGWQLDTDGHLSQLGSIDLETGGRESLDEQLERLQRNIDDPGALLGVAKDLLEAISKFVLEERSKLPSGRLDFDPLLHLALEQLGLLPMQVDPQAPGGKQLRAIYQSAKTTASTINDLRNLQGTGHGRTLPTGISSEAGRYVIREATHIAELVLRTHDRQVGRTS